MVRKPLDPLPSTPALTRRPTATAHDVAREAGVSQSAVSRAFTAGASVSPAMRGKVEAAAAKLGYRPNLIARSLITRRSNIVGVAMAYLGNQFYPELLHTLSVALKRTGRRILLFEAELDGAVDPILEEALRYRLDALVFASTTLASTTVETYREAGLPVILLNRKTDRDVAFSVTGDNHAGGRALADFLLAGGHERYAFVAGLPDSSTSRDREAGFRQGLAAAGVRTIGRGEGGYDLEQARAATRALLAAPEPPDALFCANDHMALAAIETARFEFGLEVGREVSIVGFDDAGPARWPSFRLTTYEQPIAAMVDTVAAMVDRLALDPEAAPIQAVVPGDLIVRSSARVPDAGVSGPPERRIWTPRRTV